MNKHELWGIVAAFTISQQTDLAAAYRCLAKRGSVFALTAFYEPFGLAPLEAMSCGLPAAVTRNGGPSESLQEGVRRFGVLVDPVDAADIARGILQVVGTPRAWEAYRAAGMQRLEEQYTWESAAERCLEVIQDLRQAKMDRERLPVPAYFTQPEEQEDVLLEELGRLYYNINN